MRPVVPAGCGGTLKALVLREPTMEEVIVMTGGRSCRPARAVARAAAAVLLVTTVVGAVPAFAGEGTPSGRHGVKHVILFIGDGMQLEHETAASRYLTGTDFGLSFHHLPYRGNIATWDVTAYNAYGSTRAPAVVYDASTFDPVVGYDPNLGGVLPYPLRATPSEEYLYTVIPPMTRAPATDSASAATAYSTGYKTDDGNLAWLPGDPPDGAVPTILEQLRDRRGFATGVVTTVPFDHATPAAFAAHNRSRDNYLALADEILLGTRPDVVIGGGHPLTRADSGKYAYISAELYGSLTSGGNQDYVFAERRAGVDGAETLRATAAQAVAGGKRLFGLFGGPDGAMESPVPADSPGAPAVRPGSTENPLLRDSTVAALSVVSQDPDGFFLMIEQGDIDWANHANDYARMIGTMWDLDQAVRAAIGFVNRPHDDVTWDNTLLAVTADHANSGMRLNPDLFLGRGDLPAPPVSGCGAVCVYPGGEVAYRSKAHTNELVRFYAVGAHNTLLRRYEGSWYPATGIVDNTQVYRALTQVTGLAR